MHIWYHPIYSPGDTLSDTSNTKSPNYKKRNIFSLIAHMHMKLGQMQDVRALFDEKKGFLKIPIFDVNTAIRDFSKFTHFLQIFDH